LAQSRRPTPAVEAAPVAEAEPPVVTATVPEIAPVAEASPVPEKKARRVRARAARADLGGEAGTAALEPTPEPESVVAPAQVEAAAAKAKPVVRKGAAKKSPVKKTPVKRASAKAKSPTAAAAPAEEVLAAPATEEPAKPAARKKVTAKNRSRGGCSIHEAESAPAPRCAGQTGGGRTGGAGIGGGQSFREAARKLAVFRLSGASLNGKAGISGVRR
jgi:hypothetical protein